MMKYLLLLVAAALPVSAAITTAPRKGQEGNRFLFVVDTSSSMKRLDQAGRQTVHDLIYSGLEQRMQPGDTLGVWTFGNETKGGVFPIQVWSSEKNEDLAEQVSRFLKAESMGRGSRLDNAITNVERLAKSVKDVDIILVTSAATRFKPDDSWTVLDQAWKARVDEAKKKNKPIVLALAARGGQFMQVTVTIGNEPLKLMGPPARRAAAPMARAPQSETVPIKNTREPIIMRGTSSPKPIESIPKFAPPGAAPPVEPLVTPDPEPSPVPVLNPEKPIVNDATKAQVTVAAREPGKGGQIAAASPQAPAGVSARTLIIAGASLMLLGGALGTWMLVYARSRNRTSYISRSMAEKP